MTTINEVSWLVEKRVANTDHWGVVAKADSRSAAYAAARCVEGGECTGVRVVGPGPYATPDVVRGC
jgi:hypothetical protein